jgi:hypothetical protein
MIKYLEIYNGETNLFGKWIRQKEKGWPQRTTPVGAEYQISLEQVHFKSTKVER